MQMRRELGGAGRLGPITPAGIGRKTRVEEVAESRQSRRLARPPRLAQAPAQSGPRGRRDQLLEASLSGGCGRSRQPVRGRQGRRGRRLRQARPPERREHLQRRPLTTDNAADRKQGRRRIEVSRASIPSPSRRSASLRLGDAPVRLDVPVPEDRAGARVMDESQQRLFGRSRASTPAGPHSLDRRG